jgi:hypothetical protein
MRTANPRSSDRSALGELFFLVAAVLLLAALATAQVTPQPARSFCEPGVDGVQACPCGNPPAGARRGCDNSTASGGAALVASGTASVAEDSLSFSAIGLVPAMTSVLLQGTAVVPSGASFGQGMRCTGGWLKRLCFSRSNGAALVLPGPGEPSISARSAALGDVLLQGVHRYYAVYYRDMQVLGGCPSTSTFNITQQLDVLWRP